MLTFLLEIFLGIWYTWFHLSPRFSACQIRVENALKTQVLRTIFTRRIPNNQSLLVTDSASNGCETHLPIYQSIQLICQRKSTIITA